MNPGPTETARNYLHRLTFPMFPVIPNLHGQ